jgi:purine-binding chemotaxis protein CheW
MTLSSEENQGQLLHFNLGGDQYLLPIDIIHEILEYQPVTQVPSMPDVVHGVLNLRGKYIPVIDLSRRLALEKLKINKRSCILVTECNDGSESLMIGLLVDKVNHFMSLGSDGLSPPPQFGHSIANDLIAGMTKIDGTDYIVLKVETLLNLQELIALLNSKEIAEAIES